MKKLITFIFIFLSVHLLSQENYNYFSYDIINQHKESNKILDGIISKSSDTIQYELFFSEFKTLFIPISKLNNSQESLVDLNNVFIETQGEFFYDELNKIVENKKNTLGKSFIITKDFNEIVWEKTDEIEIINGFSCKKAIYKKVEFNSKGEERIYLITAWYDEDFNYNISPFGLVGLEGLIVKIDFNNVYQVLLDDMKALEKIKPIKSFRGGIRVTQNEFDEIIKDYLMNIRKNRQGVDVSD